MVTEMMMMRKSYKKYKDVMIKQIRMDLCCEVFFKERNGFIPSANDANNNARPSMEKKRKSSFWPIGGCGYPAIPASGNIGRSDESFSIPFP